ncbi:MAG: hypothetical protein AAFO77_07030 [Pseudomonadota bacterium]
MDPATLKKLCAALETNEPHVLIIEVDTGRSRCVASKHVVAGVLGEAVTRVCQLRTAEVVTTGGQRYLIKSLRF